MTYNVHHIKGRDIISSICVFTFSNVYKDFVVIWILQNIGAGDKLLVRKYQKLAFVKEVIIAFVKAKYT